mgnify:CR=1 FL=1
MSFSTKHTTNWRTRNRKLLFFRKIGQIKQDVNWVYRVMTMMRVILVDTLNLK